MVGTGPFTQPSVQGSSLATAINPNYWEQETVLNGVQLIYIVDETTRLALSSRDWPMLDCAGNPESPASCRQKAIRF
jgi:ABC-type oligopeptide transport system substrate-binding subunit